MRVVIFLALNLFLLMPSALGAQCNATFNEAPIGSAIQISHATLALGYIVEQILTTDAIYLSMEGGVRLKIGWDYLLVWSI